MSNITDGITKIRTPMTICGLIIVALYSIYSAVLKLGIFTTLEEDKTFLIISTIIDKMFYLAVLSLCIAGGTYFYSQFFKVKEKEGPQIVAVDVSVIEQKGEKIRYEEPESKNK